MLRAILPPLIATYLVFVTMVVVLWRRPAAGARRQESAVGGARPHRRDIVRTTVGGYATFLAIVLVFHVWLAGERDAFASAVWGGAFLCGVMLGVAATDSLLARRSAGRR